jgi:TPR repeat protein
MELREAWGGRFLSLRRSLVLAAQVSLFAATIARAEVYPGSLVNAEARLATRFAASGVAYPPRSVTLIALKAEARLELWAEGDGGARFVRSYLVRATSGQLGPKLREGDHQVPEGLYRVDALNPNSHYHLSLHLDYPNAFDQAHGRAEGRELLGGEIMIHGDRVSDGCLPVGDASVEEIFALVSRIGVENVAVIVSPIDLRRADVKMALARVAQRPPWLGELYASLETALHGFSPAKADDGAVLPARRLRVADPKCKPYDVTDCAQRCEAGDLASCARAGVLLGEGRGTSPDPSRALPLLEKACTGGDALGCSALGEIILADDGLRRDASRSGDLEQAACDAGDGHGCYALAKLCTDQLLYPKRSDGCSEEQVDRLRRRAVAALHTDCRGWGAYDCQTLAAIYADGDAPTALLFASGSCSGGDPGGCDQLGQLYVEEGDRERARSLFDRACGRGYAASCARLAVAGEGVVTASR